MAEGTGADIPKNPVGWLDDRLLQRLRQGVPIIVFGAASLFDQNRFKSNEVGARFKELRDQIDELRITKLGRVAHLDPIKEGQRLHVFLNDVAEGRPRIMFLDEPFEVFSKGSCAALEHQDAVSRTLFTDRFRTSALTDAIHVDLSRSPGADVTNEYPPMTPIEEKLLDAMSGAGIEVSCQVTFEPYVVDFLVSLNGNRAVFEADDA